MRHCALYVPSAHTLPVACASFPIPFVFWRVNGESVIGDQCRPPLFHTHTPSLADRYKTRAELRHHPASLLINKTCVRVPWWYKVLACVMVCKAFPLQLDREDRMHLLPPICVLCVRSTSLPPPPRCPRSLMELLSGIMMFIQVAARPYSHQHEGMDTGDPDQETCRVYSLLFEYSLIGG